MAIYTDRVHLAADSCDELHSFSTWLKLDPRKHWCPWACCYLIPKGKIQKAIDLGAKMIFGPELVRIAESTKKRHELGLQAYTKPIITTHVNFFE